MTEDEVKAIREQIKELIESLPLIERGSYDVLMMSIDLQQEITALINQKTDATSTAVVNDKLDLAFKKQKGLDQLISLNKKTREIWDEITPDQQQDMQQRGASLRRVIKYKKEKEIKDAITTAQELAASGGENTPDLHGATEE